MTNIVSIKPIGKHQTYDLEVNHPDHQFYLSNGMLTSNSHATLYSMTSFQTAWLKAHYPIEFLVANLLSEVNSNTKASKDNITKIKSEIRAKGIKILPPDVNTSDKTYKIIDDHTLMTGLDALKYMSDDAIPNLVSNRPYNTYQDLIYKTDTSKVRSPSIQALAASGGLDSFGLERHLMFYYASDYRAKLRAHMNKLDKAWAKEWYKSQANLTKKTDERGVFYVDEYGQEAVPPPPPQDRVDAHAMTFSYPFPKDSPWTISERFAMEEAYMGEGVSGTMFDRYPKFFDKKKTIPFQVLPLKMPYRDIGSDDKTNQKANTYYLGNYGISSLSGVITHMHVFTVKKEGSKIFGREMARLTVVDPYGVELGVLAFPDSWDGLQQRVKELSSGKHKIEVGVGICFDGNYQWDNESSAKIILGDIFGYKTAPAKPAETKAKKVKMPRSKKAKAEELKAMDKTEVLEVLENEALEEGYEALTDPAEEAFSGYYDDVQPNDED